LTNLEIVYKFVITHAIKVSVSVYIYISRHYMCDVNKYHTVNIKFIVLFKK